MTKALKIAAVAVGGLLIGGLVGGLAFSKTTEVQVPGEVIEKVVTQNVTVEVPVDNGNLDLVLNHIYDNDGEVSYLTSNLNDDEVNLIVDRIIFINEVKTDAVKVVNSELFNELDNVIINGTTLNDADMERLKIDDRDYEISVTATDYADGEALVTVTGTFEQFGVLYNFEAVLEYDLGKFDRFVSVTVTEA